MAPNKKMNRGGASRQNQPRVALPAALEALQKMKENRSDQLEKAYYQLVMNLSSQLFIEGVKSGQVEIEIKVGEEITDAIASLAVKQVDACYKALDIEVTDKYDGAVSKLDLP